MPRFVDDLATPDTGNGAPPIVDMGAYELQVCGNGVVDPGEECDDGNMEPGDGCDENCRIEYGACCVGTTCSSRSEADCLDSGGVFFGSLSTCGVPDADSDGLRDECDGCPDDPYKIEPGTCGCGVDDDADSDSDAVPDCIDQCPGVDDAVFAPACVDAIPTVSIWGLLALTLLLLTVAKARFGRRRDVDGSRSI
jgi:cysteine-rich repeat protein